MLRDQMPLPPGLELGVTLDPLPEPAWVDPEIWEKIVANLLSNALKFTFTGSRPPTSWCAGIHVHGLDPAGTPIPPSRRATRPRSRRSASGRAGAARYLTGVPFSARDMLARVAARLGVSRAQRSSAAS